MHILELKNPPAGYCESSVKSGEKATVITREFTSSEDGDHFINRLEGFPAEIIRLLPKESNIKCSSVDNMLVLINKQGQCKVYINELEIILQVQVKSSVKKGDPVYEDDLADIISLEFKGIEIPKNEGIFVIFSKGWRKGLYFDLHPLSHNGIEREYELWSTLGHYYNYVFFQDLHKITTNDWNKLFKQKWFPFIGLKKKTVDSLLNYIRSDWDCDEMLNEIAIEVEDCLPQYIDKWRNSTIFDEHIELIVHAAEVFKNKDYISSTSILYPRIEGVLRNINQSVRNEKNSQKDLAKAPMEISRYTEKRYSRILPTKFIEYLTEIYFANFSPGKPAEISRNSIGHGVASFNEFSIKSSIIGFLVLEQIFYHVPSKEESNTEHQ